MYIKLGDIKNKEQLNKIKEYCDIHHCGECKNKDICGVLARFPYDEDDFPYFSSDIISIPQLQELLVWVDDEKIKLTEDEKVILRNIPKEFKYIARDKDNTLTVFEDKPKKVYEEWTLGYCSSFIYLNAFNHLYSFIKWEDDEPFNFREYLEGGE